MLHPTRALLAPSWLAALALLAINDHVWKDAWPGLITGKLSDLAGLYAAPALLASVLVVRGRTGLRACHVAIGVVFAAIKLSPWAAAAWAGLLAGLGWPWAITVDPSDLLALPALWLSWRALTPRMGAPLGGGARRILAGATGGLGLLLCAATSPPRHPHPLPEPVPLRADAITVQLQPRVEGTLELRCDDGTRRAVDVRGDMFAYLPLPAPGAECKVELLGVAGSFGPLRAEDRQVRCAASPGAFVCERVAAGP